jgi:hypothetical protein
MVTLLLVFVTSAIKKLVYGVSLWKFAVETGIFWTFKTKARNKLKASHDVSVATEKAPRTEMLVAIRHPDIRVKHCAYGHSVVTLLYHAVLQQFPINRV